MAKPTCIVRREGLLGHGVAAATALDGTQVVCEYAGTQAQQVLHAYYPHLTEAERNSLEQSLANGGVQSVEGYRCVPAEKSANRFEPYFGDHPASAEEFLKLWRAWIKYYLV